MQDVDIIASYWTLSGGALPHTDHEYSTFDFKERVVSAAKAGFKGIGLWHADLEYVLRRRSLKEMKQILDDNGIKHLELEFLTDWFWEDDRRKASDKNRKMLLEAAEVLNARHIKVGDFSAQPCPMDHMIECFAQLCKEGADVGTRIIFEMMPFANIKTLADTVALVEGAGARNGGIIFDLWHVVLLNVPYAEIKRIPRGIVMGVELNDGDPNMTGDLHDLTINHRRLCGEGSFDIAGFLQCMRDIGYDGPYGIEVLSEKLRPLGLDETTRKVYDTTISQFRRL